MFYSSLYLYFVNKCWQTPIYLYKVHHWGYSISCREKEDGKIKIVRKRKTVCWVESVGFTSAVLWATGFEIYRGQNKENMRNLSQTKI